MVGAPARPRATTAVSFGPMHQRVVVMRTAARIVPAIVLLVGGCGIGEAGMPLPRQQPGETYPGDRQELRGTLTVSDVGCFNITVDIDGAEYLVIWPPDSDYHDLEDAYALRLPGGAVIVDGESVIGTGAFTPTSPLLLERDTSMAHAIRYCAADDEEVVVFDTALPG